MTYAQKINSLYEVEASNFVTLQERLEKALAKSPFFKAQLEAVVDEFRRRNCNPPSSRGWKQFSDIKLCQAIQVPMDSILIDETMQRELNMRHILKILSYFIITKSGCFSRHTASPREHLRYGSLQIGVVFETQQSPSL